VDVSGATAADQTCSAGIAVSAGGEAPESIIRRADQALLRAKQRGRNQVALAA
jgi:PleD family two-component response regulator